MKRILLLQSISLPCDKKTLIVFWSRTNSLLHLSAFHLIGSRGDGAFHVFWRYFYYSSLVLLICYNKRSRKGEPEGACSCFIYFVLKSVICLFLKCAVCACGTKQSAYLACGVPQKLQHLTSSQWQPLKTFISILKQCTDTPQKLLFHSAVKTSACARAKATFAWVRFLQPRSKTVVVFVLVQPKWL